MTRPSEYTEDIGNGICECISLGMSLRKICLVDHMPDETTVYRWLANYPLFRQNYTRARELQAEVYFDEIGDTAREATNETYQTARLKIDALKWQASKLAPKKYGERVAMEHEGEIGLAMTKTTNRDRAKAMAALLAKARKGDHG